MRKYNDASAITNKKEKIIFKKILTLHINLLKISKRK